MTMATPTHSKRKRLNNISPALDMPGDTCKHCDKKCTESGEESKAIQCEICYSWVHATCDGLSAEEYDMLNKLSASVSNIAYCCNLNHCYSRLNQLIANPCGVANKELDQALKPVVEKHALLQESILKVSSKIEELNSQYSEIKGNIDQLSKSIDSSDRATINIDKTITTDSIANIASTLVNEEKEKEKRQLNLILHNIKESDATDSSKRIEEDVCAATIVFKDYLDVTVSVTKCFRIGKKRDDPNKPRLLKIMVSSLDEKVAVLRNKLRLRSQDNPEHIRKVFITPDLTPTEQTKNKELRSQLAEMNKVANLYKIKNGKIVRKEK